MMIGSLKFAAPYQWRRAIVRQLKGQQRQLFGVFQLIGYFELSNYYIRN